MTGRRRPRAITALVVATGVAVVALLALVAFTGSGNGTPTGSTNPGAFDLPALTGGGRVRLATLRGTPVVVDLFASWCENCREELPAFSKVSDSLRGKVTFVGIDSEETGDGRAMADEYHLGAHGFLLARDVGGSPAAGLHDALRARGMPATAIYDGAGRLLTTFNGQISEAELRDALHRLVGV